MPRDKPRTPLDNLLALAMRETTDPVVRNWLHRLLTADTDDTARPAPRKKKRPATTTKR